MPISKVKARDITAWTKKLIAVRDWLDAPTEGPRDRRALSEAAMTNTLGQPMTVLKTAHEDDLISRVPVVSCSGMIFGTSMPVR